MCENTAPASFEVGDDALGHVTNGEYPGANADDLPQEISTAVQQCPMQAIKVTAR